MKEGDIFIYKNGRAEIMAIRGIWVMARKKGAIPFVINKKYIEVQK